jgi:hypothetical protein
MVCPQQQVLAMSETNACRSSPSTFGNIPIITSQPGNCSPRCSLPSSFGNIPIITSQTGNWMLTALLIAFLIQQHHDHHPNGQLDAVSLIAFLIWQHPDHHLPNG